MDFHIFKKCNVSNIMKRCIYIYIFFILLVGIGMVVVFSQMKGRQRQADLSVARTLSQNVSTIWGALDSLTFQLAMDDEINIILRTPSQISISDLVTVQRAMSFS